MTPERWVLATALVLPFIAAALTPLLHRLVGEAVGYVGALVAATSFGLVLSQLGTSGTVSYTWIPSMDVAFRLAVDGWSLLFGLVASGIGVLIFTYATRYMHDMPNLGRFYTALLAFMGSILGVAFAADLVLLFLFWELTSVASFVLIGYHTDDDESRYAARMAMIVTVGGGLCLLVAVVLLAAVANGAGYSGLDMTVLLGNTAEIRAALEANGLFLPVLGLLTVAAAAKSAQVPLHFWLPRAMVAPTPVSAFLHSATMVKVGVYLLGRFRPLFHGFEWMLVVATLGMATMFVGAILAVLAGDMKELLAYSTASHLGLMVAGFGFTSHYGAEAGVFHLLNHALFKAALFLVAGIVAHEAGTRRLDELGGLWRDLPITAGITVVAALSMAGIPPFNGFYSKEILFEAAWYTGTAHGGLAWLYPAVAVVASVFTVVYSLRFLWLFFGERPDALTVAHRPSPLLVAPPAVLATIAAVVSISPDLAIDVIVQEAATATAVEPVDVHAGIPTELSGPVSMSIVAVLGGLVAFSAYDRVRDPLATIHTRTGRVHPTDVYGRALAVVDAASSRLDALVHNGLIRTYATWVLAAISAMTLAGYASAGVAVPAPTGIETPTALALILAVAVLAAVAVSVTNTHITGVLTLGILGFMVAVFFILASGPDLALTQLVVETLVLLVFLLVIDQLPSYYGEIEVSVAARDAALSLVVGATAFLTLLLAAPGGDAPLTETAAYYVEKSIPEGGGANVVNVILTDFRALDTLGEGIVVLIASVSVLVLLAMRGRGETT